VTELGHKTWILLALPILLGVGYERLEMQMQPGDRLLFTTDGFMRSTIPSGQERVARWRRAGRLFGEVVNQNPDNPLPTLLRRLRDLEEPLEPKDDRTALLLTLL